MNIGVLITSISNFGEKGFYNSQEIGMSKALSSLCNRVEVYKLVPMSQEESCEKVKEYPNVTLHCVPSENFGINGKIDVGVLDSTLDALVHFSDTQFSVPKVYKWAKKNQVRYIPYIGVVESHSTSAVKRLITNIKFKNNLRVYKKCECLAKTPQVQKKLNGLGIHDVTVAPVGLDMSLLRNDYGDVCIDELKEKYGYSKEKKVLLFIGRLIDEKRPLERLKIFKNISEKDDNYELMLVGTGELKERVLETIRTYGIEEKVQYIEKLPNTQIWELYCLADAFVNLNQQEIFGMAILEAMYYGCRVIAWKAPGPEFIIENGVSGWLVSNEQELECRVFDNADFSVNANSRIVNNFTWKSTAETVCQLIK